MYVTLLPLQIKIFSEIFSRFKLTSKFNSNPYSKNKAFTLIEMLIVIAILLSVSMMVIPLSISQLQKIRSNSKARELSSHMFSVQQDSYAGLRDKTYGLAFYSNRYEIFTGTSRSAADSVDNFPLPSNISLSNINFNGTNELVFNKSSFKPKFAGSLNVNDGAKSYNISVNAEGAIWFIRN